MQLVYNMVVDLFNNARTNTIEAKKGDVNSINLRFTIINNGDPFDMSDVVMASVKGVKPDDSIIYAACDIEKDEEGNNTNIVTHTLSDAATSVCGRSSYELSLADVDGNIIQSFDFYIYVVNNLFDESDIWNQNDVSAVASYMGRAQLAATTTEEVMNTFIIAYGQIDDILAKLENEYAYYVDYINTLNERVERGDFNGARGPQGRDGSNGIIVETDGIIAVEIIDGDLCVYYYDEAPPLSIDDDGCLIYTYDEDSKKLNIGTVVGSQWYSGDKITGTSTTPTVFPGSEIEEAHKNDYYINTTSTSRGNIYKCTLGGDPSTAKWMYAGNLLEQTPSADGITYDNTQSGLNADDVQEAIDELAGREAEDISYDNTTSRATADDVQEALDEAFADIKSQNSLLKSTVGWTGKNKFELLDSDIANNLDGTHTFVDGELTVNCTTTEFSGARIIQNKLREKFADLVNVPCILTFEYKSSVSCSANIGVAGAPVTVPTTWTTYTKSISDPSTITEIQFYNRDTTKSPVISVRNFMLCTPEEYAIDPSYEPYHESVEVMHEEDIYGVNILDITPFVTQTVNGVTYTKVNNEVINVTGQVTTGQSFAHASFTTSGLIPSGTYRYTDGLNKEHAGTIIRLENESGAVVINTIQSANIHEFTLTEPHKLSVRFYRDNNETGNYTIKPMLYKAELGTNIPYHKFNSQAIQNQINSVSENGAVNILPNNAVGKTENGATFTVDSDKVITINSGGVATSGNATITVFSDNANRPHDIKSGKSYIFSIDSPSNNVYGYVYEYRSGSWQLLGSVQGEGKAVIQPSGAGLLVNVTAGGGKIYDNAKAYPMITDPSYVGGYQPYAMTNRELTEKVNAETVSVTSPTQSAYEIMTLNVINVGNIVTVSGRIKSLTENAVPSGRDFISIATGLPLPLKDVDFITMPMGSGNQTHLYIATNDSTLKMRGGSTNQTYGFEFTYISK